MYANPVFSAVLSAAIPMYSRTGVTFLTLANTFEDTTVITSSAASVQKSFDEPLTMDEVLAIASPFFA
jgi:hypothetical protein